MPSTVLPITLAFWTTVIGAADLYFVNPPEFGSVGDFSSNAVYTTSQNLRVQWSEAPENVGISVLLYQLNADDGEYMLPGQYLFRMNSPRLTICMLQGGRPGRTNIPRCLRLTSNLCIRKRGELDHLRLDRGRIGELTSHPKRVKPVLPLDLPGRQNIFGL